MATAAVLRRAVCLRHLVSSVPIAGLSHPPPLLHRFLPNLPRSPASPLLSLRFASSLPRSRAPATSSSADDKLKKVLEAEIKCAQQDADPHEVIEAPEGFPFKILDVPGDQTITLERTFGSETIKVSVSMNLDSGEEMQGGEGGDGSEADDDKGSNTEVSLQPELTMIATVVKGENSALEFCCNLNQGGLTIESLVMQKEGDLDNDDAAYQGPPFSDLDESLQKAMYKYLDARGIDGSLFEFLQDYMMTKDEKEYLVWLKNMKDFIEK